MRKNDKQWMEQNSPLFSKLKNNPVTIKINDMVVTAGAQYICVRPTKLTDLGSLAPDAVLGEDGKRHTPACFDVVFDQGVLVFEREATTIVPSMKGLDLQIGENIVHFEVYTV